MLRYAIPDVWFSFPQHLDEVATMGLAGFLVAGVMGLALGWSILKSGALSGRQ